LENNETNPDINAFISTLRKIKDEADLCGTVAANENESSAKAAIIERIFYSLQNYIFRFFEFDVFPLTAHFLFLFPGFGRSLSLYGYRYDDEEESLWQEDLGILFLSTINGHEEYFTILEREYFLSDKKHAAPKYLGIAHKLAKLGMEKEAMGYIDRAIANGLNVNSRVVEDAYFPNSNVERYWEEQYRKLEEKYFESYGET
jgi:hypothetical protein